MRMSPDIPPAPPEAEVIRLARLAADMTAESAAEASRAHDSKGVSASYWRDVERGRGGRRGEVVPVRASERALAVMARVVGVTPAELTAAGREDAARVLEESLRRNVAPFPAGPAAAEAPPVGESGLITDGLTPEMQRLAAPHFPVIEELVRSAGINGPATAGSRIFSDPVEADRWDRLVEIGYGYRPGKGYNLRELTTYMSVGRVRDAEQREAERPARAHARGKLTVT